MGDMESESVVKFLLRFLVVFVAFWGVLLFSGTYIDDGQELATRDGYFDWQWYYLVMVAVIHPAYMVLALLVSVTLVGVTSGWKKFRDALVVGIGFSVFVGPFFTSAFWDEFSFSDLQLATSSLIIGNMAVWLNYLLTIRTLFEPKS